MVSPNEVILEGNGAILKMNKSEYNSMENRHALAINAGNNVTVRNLTFRDSGGDGIYISGGSSMNYSKNITIENVICENNRRQGMSIISAQNVWVKNSKFSGSSGAAPEAGVDLEPNDSSERLQNINFENCIFASNDSFGFVIGTHKLTSSSTPISINVKNCEFNNNVKGPDSNVFKTELFISQGKNSNPVKGYANFENIEFSGSKHRIIKIKKAHDAFKVNFTNCTAKNIVTSVSDSPIELEAYSGENTTGNIEFNNFYLEYSKNVPFLKIVAPSSGHIIRDVSGSFRIKEPYDNPLLYTGGYNSSKNINVVINYEHIN